MNEYKGIINELILGNYKSILVIDVFDDKIYKYGIKNNDFICDNELSYMKYLDDCRNFIYEDDYDNYIDSLSISKLEAIDKNITFSYRMKDNDTLGYLSYKNEIMLYDNNGKKIIVVLVTKDLDNIEYKNDNTRNDKIDVKLKKVIDTVGLAILKIHNVINNSGNSLIKGEYIESILSGLTREIPEFNSVFNDNQASLYEDGRSTIMIIDDDKMTCSLIKKIFDKNYDVVVLNNGEEAIKYLDEYSNDKFSKNNISCIFLDLLMPVLDGFSVLDYLNQKNFLVKIPVIIISGNYDKDTRNKAYSYQIADMLEKPFNVQVVRHRIENLINLYKSSNLLNSMMIEQHRELKNIVNSLIVSYELDNSLAMEMVRKYTRILAMQVSVMYPEYNINSNMIDKIANSSKYYAIGNYTLPKSILFKKGIYTEEERSIINMANISGASIIKHVLSRSNTDIDSKYCYEIVKYYNERYDGLGYPEGLSGNSIPLSVQIASLAIEYSNLINSIVPVDYEKVASLIIMDSGRKFSPKIVDAFKKVRVEFESITKVGD